MDDFDWSSAKPIESTPVPPSGQGDSGFDWESAKPAQAAAASTAQDQGFDWASAKPQPRSALGELGTAARRMVTVAAPESLGKQLQYFGEAPKPGEYAGSPLYEYGDVLRQRAKEAEAQPENQLQPQQHGAIVNTLAQGIEGFGGYLPAVGMGIVNPIAGAALGAAQFGSEAGQGTYEKAKTAGLSEEDALAASRRSAALAAGAGAILPGVLGKAIAPVGRFAEGALGAAAPTAEQIIKPGVVRPFLKEMPGHVATTVGTMAGLGAGQAGIEQAYGIGNESPWEAAKASIQPAVGMAVVASLLGLPTRIQNAREAPAKAAEQMKGLANNDAAIATVQGLPQGDTILKQHLSIADALVKEFPKDQDLQAARDKLNGIVNPTPQVQPNEKELAGAPQGQIPAPAQGEENAAANANALTANANEPTGIQEGRIGGQEGQPGLLALPPPGGVERRVDIEQRKRVYEMTPEEMQKELLTDPMTGMGNRRAYDEHIGQDAPPVQASLDADSLKWVNDNMSPDSGDALLKGIGKAVTDAIGNQEGVKGFHLSGDEFYVTGSDAKAVSAILDKAKSSLKDVTIEAKKPDGTVVRKKGLDFSYGVGADKLSADLAMKASKRERETTGERAARGEQPPGVLRISPEGVGDNAGNIPRPRGIEEAKNEPGARAEGRPLGATPEEIKPTEVKPNAIEEGVKPESNQPEYKGTPPGAAVPENVTEIRQGKGEQAGGGGGPERIAAKQQEEVAPKPPGTPGGEIKYSRAADSSSAMQRDMDAQAEYLGKVAKDNGHASVEDLLSKNPQAFFAAADKWRQDNPAQFSREKTATGQGLGRTRTQGLVDSFKRYYKGVDTPIRVYDTQAEFLKAMGEPEENQGVIRGAHLRDGSVALVAENLHSPKEALQVISHEVIGHHGIAKVLGDKFSPVMEMIYRGVEKDATLKALHDEVLRRQGDWISGDKSKIAQEIVALAAEYRLDSPFLSRVWGMIRDALRSVGLIKGDYSIADVKALVARSAASMREAEITRPKAGIGPEAATMYSRARGSTGDPVLDEAYRKAGMVGEPKTWTDTLKDLKDMDSAARKQHLKAVADRVKEGTFDSKHQGKVKEDLMGVDTRSPESSGYAADRMTTNSMAVAYKILMHGDAEWKQGVLQPKAGAGQGLFAKLKDAGIFENPELTRAFFGYRVGMRAQRLLGEGKEKNFTQTDIDALLRPGNDAAIKAMFDKANKAVDDFVNNDLDIAMGAGLLDKATAQLWKDYADYLPFFRKKPEGGVKGQGPKKGAVNQPAFKKLFGGEEAINDPLQNLLLNHNAMIDRAMKNQAARLYLQNLPDLFQKVGAQFKPAIVPKGQMKSFLENNKEFGDWLKQNQIDPSAMPDKAFEGLQKMWSINAPTDPNVVKIWRDGKAHYYKVEDADFLRSLVEAESLNLGSAGKIGSFFKRILTEAVTASPSFIVGNDIRDMLHTMVIYPDIKWRDMWAAHKAALTGSRHALSMGYAGSSFEGTGYLNSSDPGNFEKLVSKAMKDAGIKEEPKGALGSVFDWTKDAWEKYREIGARFENASRDAIFERTLKETGNVGKAAFASLDVMDFGMHGNFKAMRILTSQLPFFNARLQGAYVLGRQGAIPYTPQMLVSKVAQRGAMIAMASMALLYINQKDERYRALSDFSKNNYWHIFFPKTWPTELQHIAIPSPFEIGAIYKTILGERLPKVLLGIDTPKRFAQQLSSIAVDTMAIDPRPQIVKPIMEVMSNRTAFGPIESIGDEGKLPSARFNEQTSEIMKDISQAPIFGAALGDRIGVSPKQMESLMQGYLGTMGVYGLMAADAIVRMAKGAPSRPSPHLSDFPLIGAIVKNPVSRGSQNITDLYDMKTAADEIYNTVNQYRKQQRPEQAMEMLDRYKERLQQRPGLEAAAKVITTLRTQMDRVVRDKNLSATEKQARIDTLQNRADEVASKAYQRAGHAFGI